MSDKKQKFVITKDMCFKMGRVVYHRELDPNAKCGGFWFFDSETNTAYLYGESYDFGSFTGEIIEACMDSIKTRFGGAEIKFETDEDIDLYDILCKDMSWDRALELISKNDWV